MKRTLDDLTSDFDVLLSSHEDEDITRRKRQVDLQHLFDGTVDVVLTWRLGVEDLDRERPARDGERGRVAIEGRELNESVSITPGISRSISHTFSAFMVAEVTISFKSRLRDKTKALLDAHVPEDADRTYFSGADPSRRPY